MFAIILILAAFYVLLILYNFNVKTLNNVLQNPNEIVEVEVLQDVDEYESIVNRLIYISHWVLKSNINNAFNLASDYVFIIDILQQIYFIINDAMFLIDPGIDVNTENQLRIFIKQKVYLSILIQAIKFLLILLY